jgi:uncharacterized protein YcnI
MNHRLFFTTLAALATVGAQAHITIENLSAVAGSYTKVVLRVTHGCAGSPTKAFTVYVPEGFVFAKAMAKPGWTVKYESAKLAAAVQLHGRSMTETTSVIRWEGGAVPNDQFDEFALLGKVADGASRQLAFRVLQACEKGETDWRGGLDTKEPAPVLKVIPAQSGTRHSHQ